MVVVCKGFGINTPFNSENPFVLVRDVGICALIHQLSTLLDYFGTHFLLHLLSVLLFNLGCNLLNGITLVKASFILILIACQSTHLFLQVLELYFRLLVDRKTRYAEFVIDNFGEGICEIAVRFLDFHKNFFPLGEFVAGGTRNKARQIRVQDPCETWNLFVGMDLS